MIDPERENLHTAAGLLKESRHAVVFTGAGISTPSGIPDFRSTDTGLWQKVDPMLVASATAFKNHPDRFFRWLMPLMKASVQVEPNPAHHAIAALEDRGIVKSVITQNIDDLHQKAGSIRVIELHGSMKEFRCSACKKPGDDPVSIINEILAGAIPYCLNCGAIMKPTFTLFEEALPAEAWEFARKEVSQADLMLIAGSSLEVIPASSLPYDAYRNGCRVIITNFSPTYMDSRADVILRGDVAKVLPQILEFVTKEE